MGRILMILVGSWKLLGALGRFLDALGALLGTLSVCLSLCLSLFLSRFHSRLRSCSRSHSRFRSFFLVFLSELRFSIPCRLSERAKRASEGFTSMVRTFPYLCDIPLLV